MTKQEIFGQFVAELDLEHIHLIRHDFRLMRGFAPDGEHTVNIEQKLIRARQKKTALSVDYGFEVVCARDGNTVWKASYAYRVALNFAKPETIKAVMDDEELKNVFSNRQMIQFLWPYLRQELQNDTSRAGIPVFLLPPRK